MNNEELLRRVNDALKKKSSKLNLSRLNLERIDMIKSKLPDVVELDLSYNLLAYSSVVILPFLFPRLQKLDLSYNRMGNEEFKFISENFFSINELNLSNNLVGDKALRYLRYNFFKLQSLDLSGNYITGKTLRFIVECPSIQTLNISRNQIRSKYLEEVENIKYIKHLAISDNFLNDDGLSKICNIGSKLKNLLIDKNNVTDAGIQLLIERQREIQVLNVSNNLISSNAIKEIVERLTALSILLFENTEASKIIPQEISKDLKSLKGYFQDSEFVESPCIKVILLGNSSAGKTSLAYKLSTGKVNQTKSTHGIQIWNFENKNLGKSLSVNIFDFGGQDYYHATHNLFLSNKALFIILWHTSNGDETPVEQQFDINFWLGNINYIIETTHKEEESNYGIWLIQNKADVQDAKREFINSSICSLYNVDPDGTFYLSVSNADKEGHWKREWEYFTYKLSNKLTAIAGSTRITKTTIKIKEFVIPQFKSLFLIHINDYFKLCEQSFGNLEDSFYSSLNYLSGCGEVIWFKDDEVLKNIVFPNPPLFSEVIFKILSQNVKDKKGEFDDNHISEILTEFQFDKSINAGLILISVLKKFELIFEKPDSDGVFIAPQYLPENPSEVHYKKLLPASLVLKYKHYMPFGIISRFITKYVRNKAEATLWKFGAIYEESGCNVMVRLDTHEQKVFIHVENKHATYSTKIKNHRVALLKEYFDFFSISGSDKSDNRKYYNALFSSINNVDFFDVQEVKNALEHNQNKAKDDLRNYKYIPPIFNILLNRQNIIPKKIFFSYSHKDYQYRNELDVHFSALKRSGLVETWYDMEIQPGDEWDSKILSEIRECDIILLLMSADFMNSSYIWEKEIPEAVKHNRKIIPIWLRPCDFQLKNFIPNHSEYNIDVSEIQGIPFNHNGIQWIVKGESLRDEAYLNVVNSLKDILTHG